MRLVFDFANASMERPIKHKYDLLLGVVATLSAAIEDEVIYQEELFPIVELRVALNKWLTHDFWSGQEFVFTSLESDRADLLWLRRDGPHWRAGSGGGPSETSLVCTDLDVASAVEDYVARVDKWVWANCRVRVDAFFPTEVG